MERANVLSPLKLQNAKYADENSAWLIEARRCGKKAFRVYVLGGASVGKTSLCFRMSKGLLVDVPPSDDDEVHVIDLNVPKQQLKLFNERYVPPGGANRARCMPCVEKSELIDIVRVQVFKSVVTNSWVYHFPFIVPESNYPTVSVDACPKVVCKPTLPSNLHCLIVVTLIFKWVST